MQEVLALASQIDVGGIENGEGAMPRPAQIRNVNGLLRFSERMRKNS